MTDQLGLFALFEVEPAAAATAPGQPVNQWWLSDDVAERREGVLGSAGFWQREHDASGLTHSQEALYAGNLRTVAADMEARPEFYRAKPAGVSDFRWWVSGGAA